MWNFLSKKPEPAQQQMAEPEDKSERETTIDALDDLDAVLARASTIGQKKSTSTQEFHVSDLTRLDREEKEAQEKDSPEADPVPDILAVG